MKRYCLRAGYLWIPIAVYITQVWSADIGTAERSGTESAVPARTSQSGTAGAGVARRSADSDAVTLNFVNADIEGVVKAVSEITGKNFVLDPRVKGAVNIVSAKPLS